MSNFYRYRGAFSHNGSIQLSERVSIIEEQADNCIYVESLDRPGKRFYVYKEELVDGNTDVVLKGYCRFKYQGNYRYGYLANYAFSGDGVVANIMSGGENLYIKAEDVERVPSDMIRCGVADDEPLIGEDQHCYLFENFEWVKSESVLVFPYNGELYWYKANKNYIYKLGNCKENYRYCSKCGKLEPLINFSSAQRGYFSRVSSVCNNCIKTYDLVLCSRCDKYHSRDDIHERDNLYLCTRCFDIMYPKCKKCGERHSASECCFIQNDAYCKRCVKTMPELKKCSRCGIYFIIKEDENDTGKMYCDDCLELAEQYDGEILGYGKPYILPFIGDKNELYMGVELEIDKGGENDCHSQKIHKAIGKTHAVMMHDGSLNNGFEIVSAPATLKAHTEIIDWKAAMKKAIELGYCSHKTRTCGMHVHVDREYFKDKDNTLIYEDKFAMLFANNVEWIKKFSRRVNWDYCGIEDNAAVKTTRTDAEKGVCKAKPYKGSSHHVAINYGTSKPTIEIRIFRGTLSYKTFIARLQFVQLFCDFVKYTPFADLAEIGMESFISEAKTRGYSEFINNMKSLRIYKED